MRTVGVTTSGDGTITSFDSGTQKLRPGDPDYRPRASLRATLKPTIGPYRFRAVTAEIYHGPHLYFRVFARLNRPLPQQHDGGFRGVLTLNGALGDSGIGRGGPYPRCYSYFVVDYAPFPDSLRHPKPGQKAVVTRALQEPTRARVSARVNLKRAPKSAAGEVTRMTQLGCT